MTHPAPCSVVASFCFPNGRKDIRTDTMCDTNDHLFGRGLVSQQSVILISKYYVIHAGFQPSGAEINIIVLHFFVIIVTLTFVHLDGGVV